MPACVIALLGAPGPGKRGLATALHAALSEQGHAVIVVPDPLDAGDDHTGCGGRAGGEALQHLADTQLLGIARAVAQADMVLALSTPLQIAVTVSLQTGHAASAVTMPSMDASSVTLVIAPPDLQSPHGTPQADTCDAESLDAALRAALDAAGLPYGVLTGPLSHQLDAALAAIARARAPVDTRQRWSWVCERCGDGGCERHLLRSA